MTKIHIISVAKADKQFSVITDHYKKMLSWPISESKISYVKKLPENNIKSYEAELIKNKFNAKSFKIALDVNGQQLDSFKFAEIIKREQNSHNLFEFVIGGAFGLDPIIPQEVNFRISLSKLTFAHKLVKLILYEQLYRAKTIIDGHPYHK